MMTKNIMVFISDTEYIDQWGVARLCGAQTQHKLGVLTQLQSLQGQILKAEGQKVGVWF